MADDVIEAVEVKTIFPEKYANGGTGQVGKVAPPGFTDRYKQSVERVKSSFAEYSGGMTSTDEENLYNKLSGKSPEVKKTKQDLLNEIQEKEFFNTLADNTKIGRVIKMKMWFRKVWANTKSLCRGLMLVPKILIVFGEEFNNPSRESNDE
jgi:hypothetical protein